MPPHRKSANRLTQQGIMSATGVSTNRRSFLLATASTAAAPLFERSARAETADRDASDARTPVDVKLSINGYRHGLAVDVRPSLLDLLREHLALTGTKKGCDHGQCGACTVLVDDRRVLSCLTLAVAAQGAQITTIEGLAHGAEPHPVQ